MTCSQFCCPVWSLLTDSTLPEMPASMVCVVACFFDEVKRYCHRSQYVTFALSGVFSVGYFLFGIIWSHTATMEIMLNAVRI